MTSKLPRIRQRGAAIFVVMLVMALLSALGLFAVRSASLTDLASGYNRQLTQTHYVADYAVSTLAGDLANDPNKHSANMEKGKNCVGYAKQARPTCAQYSYADLELPVTNQNKMTKLLDKTVVDVATLKPTTIGSLGVTALEGDFKVELTDKHPAWPAVQGNQLNQNGGGAMLGYVMVTVSAEGMVRPAQAVNGTWDTASATAAGIEVSRANVIMGPVPQ